MKFRVYSKKKKKFLDYEDKIIPYLNILTSELEFRVIGAPLLNGEDFVIQMSTGVSDKNGVKVYEGDIVRSDLEHAVYKFGAHSRFNSNLLAAEYTKGEIVYMNFGFSVCQSEIGRSLFEDFTMCDCCPCALEVIGNIFKK